MEEWKKKLMYAILSLPDKVLHEGIHATENNRSNLNITEKISFSGDINNFCTICFEPTLSEHRFNKTGNKDVNFKTIALFSFGY